MGLMFLLFREFVGGICWFARLCGCLARSRQAGVVGRANQTVLKSRRIIRAYSADRTQLSERATALFPLVSQLSTQPDW